MVGGADLDAASLADVGDWFRDHYGPNNVVLVLAGDIGSYQKGSALLERGIEDFGLARFSPRPVSEGGAGWPTPVLFVPGNHEYDALDWDEAGITQTNSSHVTGTPTFARLETSGGTAILDIDFGGSAPTWTFTGTVVTGQNIAATALVFTAPHA